MRQLRVDDSSNVMSATWREGDLMEVEFKSGARYLYRNVQRHQFAEMAGAQSVGRWLIAHVVHHEDVHPVEKLLTPVEAQDRLARMREALELIGSIDDQLATQIIEKYGPDADKPSVHLAVTLRAAVTAARGAL